MKTVLITGAAGFIGKNLMVALNRRDDVSLIPYDIQDSREILVAGLAEADIIFHLAGVNRPQNDQEFVVGNTELTEEIITELSRLERIPMIIMSSSVQAALENPYGASKLGAEHALEEYAHRTGAAICIYRLPNVFGKWSRPNYNTVVATFCHNIARGLTISINDPERELELVYIDDVVEAFVGHLDSVSEHSGQRYSIPRTFRTTVSGLAEKIRSLGSIRDSLVVPDLNDDFMKCLHATYLSFLPENNFSYPVKLNTDDRGWLFELIKSEHSGQIFVSKTLPGVTRGNHYHDTKLEKFCVIQGEGVVRLRLVDGDEVLEYPVNDSNIHVLDIPPGYTHSIENTGDRDMLCLFWANQILNPERPDTYFLPVVDGRQPE